RYHPGGSLGKKLYLRVDELVQEQKPQVLVDSSLHEVIIEISSKRLGAVAVLKDSVLVGLVTDGDLRRMLQKTTNLEGVCAADIMTHNPKSIDASSLAAEALAIMEECNITQLIVLENGSYKGLIHLHDILKEGII
ncbi:MAG: arabinose-5-phosphate isomerase, partial [Flavobacteriales bacterium]